MSDPAATPQQPDSDPTGGRLLTLADAAKVATVSKATLQRRLKDGAIPGATRTDAGGWLIPAQALIDAGLADTTIDRDYRAELAAALLAVEAGRQAVIGHAGELERLAAAKDDEHRRTHEQLRQVLLDREAERARHAAELERIQADADKAAAMYERQLEALTGTVDALRQLVEGVAALMPARTPQALIEATGTDTPGRRSRWRRR